jgi:hypothetical protein
MLDQGIGIGRELRGREFTGKAEVTWEGGVIEKRKRRILD